MSDTFDHEGDAWSSLDYEDSFDEFNGGAGAYIPSANKVCRRCGATGLRWCATGKGYRLFNLQWNQHVCDNAASPDEFEVVV